MSRQSPKEKLIAELLEQFRISGSQNHAFDNVASDRLGINRTDLACLDVITRFGPVTAGEIAAEAGLTTGAVTAVVDRLERAGYVTRERDVDDRRRVIVTAQVDTVLNKVGPIYGRVGQRWADYLATLTDEQIEFANELFARAAEINREEIEALRAG